MYLVLAACCLAVTLSSLGGLALLGRPETQAGEGGTPPEQQLVTESNYDRDANTIDNTQYDGTILPAGEDAGEDYVRQTLFLGDSNTARMYRLFDYCGYENAIGSVGMAARSLANYACAGFDGVSGYVTMPQAVAMMQPRRVIITFGTNDLNPNYNTEIFITNYRTGIQSVQEAYPSVDIIVNAIPPLGRQHSGEYLTQSQIDEWNKALVTMCEENGWKFLNSAEALKDETTGFARSGYVEADGIHLTTAAFDAFFSYVRTHSYITEDDRPALQPVPTHTRDRDVVDTAALATPTPPPVDAPPAVDTPVPVETPAIEDPVVEDPVIEDPVTDLPPAEPTPVTDPVETPAPDTPQDPSAGGETPTEAPPAETQPTETQPTEAPPAETPTEAPPAPDAQQPPADPAAPADAGGAAAAPQNDAGATQETA